MNYADIFAELSELRGRRLALRPVLEESAESLFDAVYESRVELRRFMPWETEELGAIQTFLEASVRERQGGKGLGLNIFELETGELSGGMGLLAMNQYTPRAEVGYWIRSTKAGPCRPTLDFDT